MAITKDSLKEAILSEIDKVFAEATPVEDYFYLKVIKDYIEANAEVKYSYTGVTPTPSPDPLNGTAQAKIKCPLLEAGANVKAFVHGRTKADPTGFVTAIMQDALGTTELQSPYTGVAATIYSVVGVQGGISETDNYKDAWDFICDAVIKSFLTLTTAPAPTTTTSPGSGVSTFVSVQ